MDGLSPLLQAFADFLTPLFRFILWICPKVYRLHDGEIGVIKTLGRVRRAESERGPGLTFCFPFEEMETIQALGGYIDLAQQAIWTKDGKVMIMNGALEYVVKDARIAILETEQLEDHIEGICMDAMRQHARETELKEIVDSEKLGLALTVKANRKVRSHGAMVKNFMITDLRPHDVTLATDAAREIFKK